MKYSAEIKVTLKDDIKDPQGSACELVLKRINLAQNAKIRTGKFFSLSLEDNTLESAKKTIKLICEEVLSNPNIEQYEILKVVEE